MNEIQKNYNKGIKTLIAWDVAHAVSDTESFEKRKDIISRQLGYQKNVFSADELNSFARKFEVVSENLNATVADYKAVIHDRIPSNITISAKDMIVLQSNTKQKTIV